MSMKDQVEKAIAAHEAWKQRLASAIESGSSTFDTATVSADNACDFGKWLHGLGDSDKGGDFETVRSMHADFHTLAGKILGLATGGSKAEAETLMSGEFSALSGKLVSTLNAWA